MSDIDEIYLICIKCGIVHEVFVLDADDVEIWRLKAKHSDGVGCGKECFRVVTVEAHADLKMELQKITDTNMRMGLL